MGTFTLEQAFGPYKVGIWDEPPAYRTIIGDFFNLNETGGPNQLSFDSEFDNAYWSKNAGALVTANAIAAPDQTLTADRFYSGSGGVAVGLYRAISVDAGESMSIFAKANTCSKLALIDAVAAGAWAQFDLSLGSVNSSSNCTATIEDFGNGWYRVTAGAVSATGGFFIIQGLDSFIAGNPWATGTMAAGTGLYLWHARLWLP